MPRTTIAISVLVSDKELTFQEYITINNVDKKSVNEIALNIKDQIEEIKSGRSIVHNKRKLLEKYLPSLYFIDKYSLLSSALNTFGYLSSCGVDLSFVGFPKYSFAPVILTPAYALGFEEVYFPIPGNAFFT